MKAAIHQKDNEKDHSDQTEAAAWIIAPATAIGHDGRGAEHEYDKNDKQKQHEFLLACTQRMPSGHVKRIDAFLALRVYPIKNGGNLSA